MADDPRCEPLRFRRLTRPGVIGPERCRAAPAIALLAMVCGLIEFATDHSSVDKGRDGSYRLSYPIECEVGESWLHAVAAMAQEDAKYVVAGARRAP